MDDIYAHSAAIHYKSMSHQKFGNRPNEVAAFSAALQPKRGTFLWTVISKTWPGIIRSKIVFLESVAFQLRYGILSLFPAQFLKRYGRFFGSWGRDRSQSPPCRKTLIFSGKTKTEIHGLDEDITATA